MGHHAPTDKRFAESYKMNFKGGKKVYRICLGVYCRSEKMFWSFNGARLCGACKAAIENVNTDEPPKIYLGR